MTKTERTAMRGFRSGICQCSDRGFFILAGKRTPCPLCAGKAPVAAPDPEKAAKMPPSVLERKLGVYKRRSERAARTNILLQRRISDMITAAEAQGINLNRRPGRPGKETLNG